MFFNTKKKTYEELQSECGMRVGDRVRLDKKLKTSYDGWEGYLAGALGFGFEGNIGVIVDISSDGIFVSFGYDDAMFCYPYFVLTRVPDDEENDQEFIDSMSRCQKNRDHNTKLREVTSKENIALGLSLLKSLASKVQKLEEAWKLSKQKTIQEYKEGKVYCEDCEHYTSFESLYYNRYERCNVIKNSTYKDTYRKVECECLVPEKDNKDNHCKYFEPKTKEK